jgi:hypothetical protein
MTLTELSILIDDMLDKSNTDWFNNTEKEYWINKAAKELALEKYEEFQLTEKGRQYLSPLTRKVIVTAVSSFQKLTTCPDFMLFTSFLGSFVDDCGNTQKVPIVPLQDDDGRVYQDPFWKPDDITPWYEETFDTTLGAEVIQVLSTTTPTSIEIRYLKLPRKVSFTTNTMTDLPEIIHEELANVTVRMMLSSLQQPNSYQVQQIETQEGNQ